MEYNERLVNMKNIQNLVMGLILSAVALPVLSVCPIEGGSCTAFSNWESKPLQQKYVPNHITPYHSELINTETSNATVKPPANDYNSNCQFGVCLPGVEGGGSVLE